MSLDRTLDGANNVALDTTFDAAAGAAAGSSYPHTTKGDLAVHDGTEYQRVAAGSDGEYLIADSTEDTGVKTGAISYTKLAVTGGVGNTSDAYYGLHWEDNTTINVTIPAANRWLFTPMPFGGTGTMSRIQVRVAVGSAGTLGLVLTTPRDDDGLPGVVVASGTASSSSAGDKIITVDYAMTPGLYWLGVACTSTSVEMEGLNTGNVCDFGTPSFTTNGHHIYSDNTVGTAATPPSTFVGESFSFYSTGSRRINMAFGDLT